MTVHKCPHCEYETDNKGNLTRHMADIHNIGITWYHCPEDGCDHKTKQKGNLKQHLADIHNIGVVWHHCPEEGCDYKAKRNRTLKQHLADIHNIGVVWHQCPEEGCDHKTKQKGRIKKHLANIHNIDVTWYHCPENGCDYKAKEKRSVKQHLADIHNIGVVWHQCPEEGCDHKTKQKGRIKKHLANIHNIDVVWHHCPEEGCDYKAKEKRSVKQHLADIHDIGVTWYYCPEPGCGVRAKQKGNLVAHQKTHDPVYQARQKAKETKLYHYLCKHYNVKREHQITFNCLGSSFCRIDFLIIHNQTVFLVECDEFQHNEELGNYSVRCETRRMCDAYASLSISGNQMPIHFIRFNPDGFQVDGEKVSVRITKRYNELRRYINSFRTTQPFSIRYMFYDTKDGRPVVLNHPNYSSQLAQYVLTSQ